MTPSPLTQASVFDLVFQAGIVAKMILLLLFFVSIVSWAIIFSKWKRLSLAHRQNEKFIQLFFNGKNLDEVVIKSEQFPNSPVASVFNFAVKELRRLSPGESTPLEFDKLDNIHRALARASHSQIATLEKNVGFLATTASAAPFVGLFGTVWGIMNSFQNIGATGAANLAVVAPGISEALITTATGIGAAIPAVIAYNYFGSQIKRIAVDMECFSQDFINIIQRSLAQGKKGK